MSQVFHPTPRSFHSQPSHIQPPSPPRSPALHLSPLRSSTPLRRSTPPRVSTHPRVSTPPRAKTPPPPPTVQSDARQKAKIALEEAKARLAAKRYEDEKRRAEEKHERENQLNFYMRRYYQSAAEANELYSENIRLRNRALNAEGCLEQGFLNCKG